MTRPWFSHIRKISACPECGTVGIWPLGRQTDNALGKMTPIHDVERAVERDRAAIREAFCEIVKHDYPNAGDGIVGELDSAFAVTPIGIAALKDRP